MIDVAERLKAQNNGSSWRSCPDGGRLHRFLRDGPIGDGPQGLTSYHCTKCPTATLLRAEDTAKNTPNGFPDVVRRILPSEVLRRRGKS